MIVAEAESRSQGQSDAPRRGATWIEAKLDRGSGTVATVLCRAARLNVGAISIGRRAEWGGCARCVNERARPCREAGP